MRLFMLLCLLMLAVRAKGCDLLLPFIPFGEPIAEAAFAEKE